MLMRPLVSAAVVHLVMHVQEFAERKTKAEGAEH